MRGIRHYIARFVEGIILMALSQRAKRVRNTLTGLAIGKKLLELAGVLLAVVFLIVFDWKVAALTLVATVAVVLLLKTFAELYAKRHLDEIAELGGSAINGVVKFATHILKSFLGNTEIAENASDDSFFAEPFAGFDFGFGDTQRDDRPLRNVTSSTVDGTVTGVSDEPHSEGFDFPEGFNPVPTGDEQTHILRDKPSAVHNLGLGDNPTSRLRKVPTQRTENGEQNKNKN
jgi:hypothetical protein